MINATELRIGNFISHNKNEVKVFELPYLIDLDENKEGYLINSIWADEFEPIPLTEEVLKKCGFKYQLDDCYFLALGDNRYKYGLYYIGFIQLAKDIVPIANFKHVIYLHQLQNLYFTLTGEELQYTPCK